MSRTTAEAITSIINFDTSITDLTPFIESASELVTEICEATGEYSEARLELIERWLAAHFVAIRDPRYVSQQIGQAANTYQQKVGMNLSLTPYGQQAMMLDTKGGLAWLDKHIASGKRAVASVAWLGNCNSRRITEYPWRFFGIFQ
jgi:hypothetical protein